MKNGTIQNHSQSSNTSIQQKEPPIVFFNLKTGGIGKEKDIFQIAAVCDNKSFMQYVTPTKDVSPGTKKVNQLTIHEGVLMKIISKNPLTLEPLQTIPVKETLQKFMAWLDDIGQCYLVGHSLAVDKKHFLFHLKEDGLLQSFNEKVLDFIDTLFVYRKLYPKLKQPIGFGHKQCDLIKHFMAEEYDANDALESVKALKRLVERTKVSRETLMYHTKSNRKKTIQSTTQPTYTDIQKNESALVFFDLETGGLAIGKDILQVAAVCDNQSFMQYVTPTKEVDLKAQEVNKLTKLGDNLMKIINEEPLDMTQLNTLPIKETLQNFVNWLDEIGPCFLVGHNVSFDKRHFLHHINQENLSSSINEIVLGFTDTLPLYRELYPELKKTNGPGYRQSVLVEHFLQEKYGAHDALEDVKALKRLVEKTKVSRDDLIRHTKL